jgi:hypothetical protein
MGLGITESEMLERLAARDCQPLSAEETALFVELFRRATGGVKLITPSKARPVATLPIAWLSECFMASSGHVANAGRMQSTFNAYSGGRPMTLVYDPLGEDETGNPIKQGHE